MLMINFLIGLLVVVTFALTFLLGIEYGKNRMRKVYSGMLINQHACLNWALEYVMAPDDVDSSTTEEEMAIWNNDYNKVSKVAEGDIDALLSEKQRRECVLYN